MNRYLVALLSLISLAGCTMSTKETRVVEERTAWNGPGYYNGLYYRNEREFNQRNSRNDNRPRVQQKQTTTTEKRTRQY